MKIKLKKPFTIKERTILCQLVIGNLVPKLVAPKYDISELDRHFLEEDILTELDKEEEGYSPDEPMDYHEFKKTAEKISSTSSNSGLKSASMPTMSCTAAEKEETSSETNSEEDGSCLFDPIDISSAKEFGEDFYQQARALFIKYQTTFSKTDMDLGRAANVKHHIILSDPIPFKERYRRIPPQRYDEIRNHLQEMLRLGAIRRSCSPWASAIVLVRKKNGKLRFCIDLRKLNSKTLKDSYALPRIEQTLESLADSMVYSTLDLTSGYWQVEMAEECKPYTAFTCGPLGFFEC